MWLAFALLSSAFYAMAETIDNFLVNKKFKHPLTLVFFTSLFNLVFVPILFFFQPPELPPLDTLPIFVMLGLAGVGYLYPYYRGLQSDDTSVAISFFGISRIFIPVLAFIVVGEVLAFEQYFGIFLILASVTMLSLHHARRHFKFSRAVWYIGLAALILAFEGVFFKLLFEKGVTVSTAIGGEALVTLMLGMSLLLSRKMRKDIAGSVPLFLKLAPLMLIEEFFTFLGLTSEGHAISSTSVSVVKGVTMASPFFILLYAWAGRGVFPSLFKEDLHRKMLTRKILLFTVLIFGIILVKE